MRPSASQRQTKKIQEVSRIFRPSVRKRKREAAGLMLRPTQLSISPKAEQEAAGCSDQGS